ncbi:hypothetical protein [Mycobacterium sp. 852013-50091_SCH5140682]|nr:hypothetical protein [Mycobacterium sp. 852013-50091_SCH5140682]
MIDLDPEDPRMVALIDEMSSATYTSTATSSMFRMAAMSPASMF